MSDDIKLHDKRVLPIRERVIPDARILIAYSQKASPRDHDVVGHTEILYNDIRVPKAKRSIRLVSLTEENGRHGTPITDAHTDHNFDICITIGFEATVRAIKELLLLGWNKPHFFVGVQEEQLQALYEKKLIPDGYPLRGVVHVYEGDLDSLVLDFKTLAKKLDSALITKDHNEIIKGHDFGQYGLRNKMVKAFERAGVLVDYATVFPHKTKVSRSLESRIQQHDIIVMTNQAGALAKTESFKKICNKNQVLLAAFDRAAIKQGASMGIGASTRSMAQELVSLLHEGFVRGKPISEIENRVLKIDTTQTWYNLETVKKQNGKLSDDILRALKMLPIDAEEKI